MKDLQGEELVKDNTFDMLRERESISEADLEKELNFKTAVKGFNKREVAEYIAELNRGFQIAQASLTGKISQLSDEVAVLKYERERNVAAIHDLKVQLAGGENNIDESYFFDKYKSNVDTLKNEKASLKKRNDEISEKYRAASNENNELKQSVKQITDERDKLLAECGELRDQIVMLSSQAETLAGQNKSLQNEKDKLFTENSSLMAVGNEAGSRVNEIQAEKNSLAEKNKQMAAEITALSSKLQAVSDEVKFAREENSKLESKLASTGEEKTDLERKLIAAKESKEVSIRTLKQEIGKLTREKTEAEKKIEELKSDHESKASVRNYELEELKASYDKLQEKFRIGERTKEIQSNAKAREIMSLKKENAELKEKLETMSVSGKAYAGDENSSLKSGFFGRFGLPQKGKDIEADISSLREEIDNLKQTNMELSSQLTKTKKSKETEYTTLNKIISGLKQDNVNLLEKLAEAQSSDKTDSAQVNQLIGERDMLLEQNGDYREKISALLNKTELYEDKIKNLSAEISYFKETANRTEHMANIDLVSGMSLETTSEDLIEKNRLLEAKLEQLQNKNDELIDHINQKKDEIYDLKQIIGVDSASVQSEETQGDDGKSYVDGVDRRLNKL